MRYVAVAAFTLWRDTFDHGWVMPFLTAGAAVSYVHVEEFVLAARSPRHVRVGWRAGGAPHVDDVPDPQLDLSYDLLGWDFLCRNDTWSCLQHLLHLAGTLCKSSVFWHSPAAWKLLKSLSPNSSQFRWRKTPVRLPGHSARFEQRSLLALGYLSVLGRHLHNRERERSESE